MVIYMEEAIKNPVVYGQISFVAHAVQVSEEIYIILIKMAGEHSAIYVTTRRSLVKPLKELLLALIQKDIVMFLLLLNGKWK